MTETEFKERTKGIALRVIRLVEALPNDRTSVVLGRQLLRSATSIGANYRAACRGKSTADVINKLAIVEEEGDESLYWLELLAGAGALPEGKMTVLYKDIDEIVAMTVASIKTLRSRDPKSKIQNPKSRND